MAPPYLVLLSCEVRSPNRLSVFDGSTATVSSLRFGVELMWRVHPPLDKIWAVRQMLHMQNVGFDVIGILPHLNCLMRYLVRALPSQSLS